MVRNSNCKVWNSNYCKIWACAECSYSLGITVETLSSLTYAICIIINTDQFVGQNSLNFESVFNVITASVRFTFKNKLTFTFTISVSFFYLLNTFIFDYCWQVQTVTISYLRCILEHVRCYILDRDVELVYGAVKKSSDILTRDPMQLGAQVSIKTRNKVL